MTGLKQGISAENSIAENVLFCAGLLEEEASLLTAEAAAHRPLDAGRRNWWYCVSGR
jgi:hypothetical protein